MDVAQADCTKRMTCSNSFGLDRIFGSESVCVTRTAAQCVAALAATGTAATPQTREACALDLPMPDYTCVDWFDGAPTAACTPPAGMLAAGTACGASAQCASTFCEIGANAVCGTCQPLPAVGATCTVDADCGRDLACAVPTGATSGKCAMYAAQSAPCLTGSQPCQAGLSCVGDNELKATTGTCMPAVTAVNGACDSARKTIASCDPTQGLACIPSGAGVTTGTCQTIDLVAAGQTCGLIGTPATSVTDCAAGGLCVKARPTDRTGTCVAPAADGAACDSALGPPCLAPSQCVPTAAGSTAGTCTVSDATMCH